MARMLKTIGIVDACFPDVKARSRALRRFTGKPVVECVARRATEAQRLAGVIVITNVSQDDRQFLNAVPFDIPVFHVPGEDCVKEWAETAAKFSADGIVRIGLDHPLLDPALIDRLVIHAESHDGLDYICYARQDGTPAAKAPIPVCAEWFNVSTLCKLAQSGRPAKLSSGRLGDVITASERRFRVERLSVPSDLDRDDIRLRIDADEDWENIELLCELWGTEHVDMQRLARILRPHSHLELAEQKKHVPRRHT